MRLSNKFDVNLCIWVSIMLSFGYPLQVVIPLLIKGNSNTFNIAFRFAYALFLSCLLANEILKGINKKVFKTWFIYLIIFWGIYLARLIVDVGLLNISFAARSNFWVYSMAIGNGFLPFFVISIYKDRFNMAVFVNRSYCVLVLVNIANLILVYTQYGTYFAAEAFLQRANIKDSSSDDVISAITVGTYANILFSVSLIRLFVAKVSKPVKLLFLAGMALGVLNLVLSASRGPILFTVVNLIIIVLYLMSKQKSRSYALIKLTAVVLILMAFIPFSSIDMDLAIFKRLETFTLEIGNGVKEARNYEYESAIEQFANNPIFGDRYLNRYDNYYPHNIFLEVLMATGLIGAIPFLLFFRLLLKRVKQIFTNKIDNQFTIAIMVLSLAISTLTSGGIFTIPFVWASLPLLFINPKKSLSHDKNTSTAHSPLQERIYRAASPPVAG